MPPFYFHPFCPQRQKTNLTGQITGNLSLVSANSKQGEFVCN